MTDHNKSFDDLMKLIHKASRGPRPAFAAPPDRRMSMDTIDLIQHEFKSRQKVMGYLIETVLNPEFEKLPREVKGDILSRLTIALSFAAMMNMAQALGTKGSDAARRAVTDFGELTIRAIRDARNLINVLIPKETTPASETDSNSDSGNS